MAKGTKELIIKNTRAYLKSLGVLKSVSLSMILKAIGISKGTFYHYFKDKDELFYEVIIPEIRQKEIEINKQISTTSHRYAKDCILCLSFLQIMRLKTS